MKERPLDSSSLFSTLLAKGKLLLSRGMETQKFSQGEEIFAQGALSEAHYLIESGWVRLTRKEKGERLTIANEEVKQTEEDGTGSLYAMGGLYYSSGLQWGLFNGSPWRSVVGHRPGLGNDRGDRP